MSGCARQGSMSPGLQMADGTERHEAFHSGWTGVVTLALIAYVAIAILAILLDGQGGRALEVFNLYSDSLASIGVSVLAAAAARGSQEPAARRTWWFLTAALSAY